MEIMSSMIMITHLIKELIESNSLVDFFLGVFHSLGETVQVDPERTYFHLVHLKLCRGDVFPLL